MKRNHRKNRFWISILLIVALMAPMLPSFALAEEEVSAEVVEFDLPQMAEMEAELSLDDAAAAAAAEEEARIAAEQAAAEEAARIAAEQAAAEQAAAEEAARIAAEQAAAEEAARIAAEQAAAEEAARIAAEQAAAEEAARIAAEQAAAEEAARLAAEQAAAEEAARLAAEQAAAEEAARLAAEQAAAEEAARAAAEQAAAEEAARAAAEQAAAEEAARAAAEQAAEEQAELEATEEPAPEPTEAPTETPTVEPTAAPTEAVAVAAVAAAAPATDTLPVITKYEVKSDISLTEKPATEAKARELFESTLTATLSDNTKVTNLGVKWTCSPAYDSQATGKFTFSFELDADTKAKYSETASATHPTVQLTVTSTDEYDIEANDDSQTADIIKWNGTGANVNLVVPAQITYNGKQYTVTRIKEKAFYDKDNLNSIVLPEGLTEIGANALANCDHLIEITVPNGVKEIGENAFWNCEALKEITIPDSATTIGEKIFDSDKVKTVRLSVGKKTTLVGEDTFAPTPEGNTIIKDSAKIKLPAAITDIEVKKAPSTATEGGTLTIATDYTVPADHTMTVNEGCTVEINAGKKLTNKGKLENKGTISNKGAIANDGGTVTNSGTIYSCYPGSSVADGIAGNVVKDHAFESNVCTHCGIKDITGAVIDDIADQKYTGSAIEPGLTVKFGETALKKDTDYTVTFDANINPGTATATITGINEFTKQTSKTFVIKRTIDKNNATIEGVNDSYTYTGSEIKPAVKVKLDGVELVAGTDYTVAYEANTAIGTAKVTVTGAGFYDGSVSKSFKIVAISIKDASVSGLGAKTYTGSDIKPSPTLKYKGATLVEGTDYTLSYKDNKNVGNATVTITGKGNYADSRTETFAINRASISGISVTGIEDTTYNGKAHTFTLAVKLGDTTLKSGTDYNVAYSNNVDAGTATVTITGAGNYTGSVPFTFSIAKKEQEIEIKLKTGSNANKVYDKTRNLLLTSSDFTFSPAIASTETVKITKISGSYDKPDVGTYSIPVTFEVSQTKSKNYTYKLKSNTVTLSGKITAKQLTIRPGVEKSSTDSTLVSQTKVYGTANPSSYKAKVGGIMTGDSLASAVTGALAREEGENVGKYKITIGKLKTQGNYAATPILEEGYFEITPKSVNATDVGMVALGNQKYTGSAIEPEITLKYTKKVSTKTETETLVRGTDYTVKYSNNVEPGTATVTITGRGNYTGTRTATFRILKVSSTTTTSTTTKTTTTSASKTTTTSSKTSTVSGGEGDSEDDEDDDDEVEEDSEKVKARLKELLAMSKEDLEKLAKSLDIDPADFDDLEELAREIITYEADDPIGELVLDEEPYGTILFSADDMPRPFLLYDELIHPDNVVIADEASKKGSPSSDRRLRIEAMNMQDEDENDLFLDEEEEREKYEELHLRLTPNQVDVLKSKNIVELVYVVENAELHIPVSSLPGEIDVAPFEKSSSVQYVKPETKSASAEKDDSEEIGEEIGGDTDDEDTGDDEDADDDEIEIVEADDKDRTVLESIGVEMTPDMREINQYDFCILQLVDDNMSDREKAAVEDKEVIYPYRLEVYALNGEAKEPVMATDDLEGISVSTEEAQDGETSNFKRYPMLQTMEDVELRIIVDDDPSEDTQQVFVADDATIQNDNDAIDYPELNFVEDEEITYASFNPRSNGMYAVLENEEEFEPLPFVTYGPVNTPVPSVTPAPDAADEEIEVVDEPEEEAEPEATPEPELTPEPTPEPTATPEPEPEVIEDPDPVYAYSRRSNEGNQYWLVNTVDKTVEYYSEADDEYWTGEYTGSLMSGMKVQTSTGKSIDIALKFTQTYKFALMNGDGPELLMEEDKIDEVTAALSAHR